MARLEVRHWSLAGLAFCVLMMAVALGLEHLVGLEPCPLCIFQRVAVIAAGFVFAVAAIHNPAGRLGAALYGVLSLAAVGTGIGVAGRHLWLQSLPADEVPSCGPGLDYMLDILPLQEVVNMVLSGSGECAEVDFLFLG
ncbi:MAG: disulfide bond formation protein B, partial [Halomonas sp.]|nr:disulfide bond formation protein B [Halomonas sp.]